MLEGIYRKIVVLSCLLLTAFLTFVLCSCGAYADATSEDHEKNSMSCRCGCTLCTDDTVTEGEECPLDALEPEEERESIWCVDKCVEEDEMNDRCNSYCSLKVFYENMSYGSYCGQIGDMEIYESGEDTCNSLDIDMRLEYGDPPYTLLQIDEDKSRIKIKINGDSGSQKLRGHFGFTGGNCPGSTCEIVYQFAVINAPNFEVDGVWPIHLSKFFTYMLNSASGTVYPNGNFVVPETLYSHVRLNVWKRLFFDKDITFTWRTSQPLTGTLDFSAKQFSGTSHFEEDMDGDYVEADVDIVATWENLSPLVTAEATSTVVECDAPGTGIVHLFGHASDSDGEIVATRWIVNRQIVSKDRITSHPFPLGTSRVTFIAVDNEGAHSEATLQIWVVDTTPPELGPVDTSIYCAAAPNHKYIKLELGDEVMVTVNDICDPNPTVTFVDALCDELDNGIGDGNTTDDIVLFPDAVCLRSERSGVEDGRKYTVAISAEDFRGNKSAGEFDIRVDHDQRDHDCPPLPPSTFISHSDALLQCPAPPADSAQVSKTELETEVGCAVVSNGNLTILPTLCAFFLLLFLRKSRTT